MEKINRPTHRSILFKRHRSLKGAEVIEPDDDFKIEESTNIVVWLLSRKPIRESQ